MPKDEIFQPRHKIHAVYVWGLLYPGKDAQYFECKRQRPQAKHLPCRDPGKITAVETTRRAAAQCGAVREGPAGVVRWQERPGRQMRAGWLGSSVWELGLGAWFRSLAWELDLGACIYAHT